MGERGALLQVKAAAVLSLHLRVVLLLLLLLLVPHATVIVMSISAPNVLGVARTTAEAMLKVVQDDLCRLACVEVGV